MGVRAVFPLVDQYMGIRMEVDLSALAPGRAAVVASPRRLRKEQSYGYIHALWWLWLEDGRSAASVPPGAAEAVGEILEPVASRQEHFDPNVSDRLKAPVDAALINAGLKPSDRVIRGLILACDAAHLRRNRHGDCRQLTGEDIPPAEGLKLPTHCFPDGIVYGIVADGKVAAVAHAHRSGLMEDRVADLGVETAIDYRRRGYAKTAISAVVEHIVAHGGEAKYGCSPNNIASIATARSVGFVPYATSLILSAPRGT